MNLESYFKVGCSLLCLCIKEAPFTSGTVLFVYTREVEMRCQNYNLVVKNMGQESG